MIDTNDSDAPWNQRGPEPVAFTKRVGVYLTKEMRLHTTYYEEHVDCDGNLYVTDESDGTDFLKEFQSKHHSIPELLDILAKQAELRIAELECEIKLMDPTLSIHRQVNELKKWRTIIEECAGWKVEDIDIDDV